MQPKSKRRLFVFLGGAVAIGLAVALVAGPTGCRAPRTEPSGAARPHEGTVLKIAGPADLTGAVLNLAGRSWAAREGCRLEAVAGDAGREPPAEPAGDVWLIPPAELPHWAAAGRLLAVPKAVTAPDGPFRFRDLLPVYKTLLEWDGTTYAVPVVGEGPLCFYRTDLLQTPAHLDVFRQKYGRPPAPPATWQEFVELAEFFRDRPADGLKGPSLPPLPAHDDDLDRLFYQVAASFVRQAVAEDVMRKVDPEAVLSFHYDLKTGKARLDAAGFAAALQLLRRLQDCRPKGAVAEPAEAFLRGEAVLCVADASWLPRLQGDQSAVRGKFSVCRIPGSRAVYPDKDGPPVEAVGGVNYVPYLGSSGWLAVVPKTCANPDAAFALLTVLGGPDASRQILLDRTLGGRPTRRTHLDNRDTWLSFRLDLPLTEAVMEGLRRTLAHPGMANPLVRLRTPDERPHFRAVVAEVRRALAGEVEPRAVLAAAAARWDQLDAESPPAQRLADYFLSLGLSPPRR